MEVTLHLRPEIEARLAHQAQVQGITIEQLLEQLIERLTTSDEVEPLTNQLSTDEEWSAALDELSNLPSLANAPPLSDEALRRENLYTGKTKCYELPGGYNPITFNIEDFNRFTEITAIAPQSIQS